MRRNLSELEQKIILLLKRNSRMSIVDMASELGTSRITAKKALDSIISSGRIKKFTISLADEEKDMVLLYTDSLENIPGNVVLERFSLIDGSYMVILYYEDLIKIKKTNIKRVEIATSRESYENMKRVENIRCDYCGKEIKNNPISVEIRGKTYYLCCPNCERDIKKRGEMILEEDSRH